MADGTYTGTGNKNLSWSGKHITVRSENGPNNCIIDCENSGRAFYFNNSGTGDLVLGFTIKNGNAGDGGGIYCNNSSPSITYDDVWNNNGGITLAVLRVLAVSQLTLNLSAQATSTSKQLPPALTRATTQHQTYPQPTRMEIQG
ncbi:MAG: hypothetical protein AB1630_05225 [bacterium]